MKKFILISLCFSIAGCTEFSALNQKVGDWAGEINKMINVDNQKFEDTVTSKRDIDTLYVRISAMSGLKQ